VRHGGLLCSFSFRLSLKEIAVNDGKEKPHDPSGLKKAFFWYNEKVF
jgi:hypothetical protein